MIRVLFVCTGNICRSPTAEGLFTHKIEQRGWGHRFAADSAGMISFHGGEPPQPTTVNVARRKGVELGELRARQLKKSDFEEFDYLIALDSSHEADMRVMAPAYAQKKIHLLMSFDKSTPHFDVPDPYARGVEAFEETFRLCESGVEALLTYLDEKYP